MPSPFPGMDPYLEDPRLWPDVHHRFITAASDLLMEQIRPRYFVRIEERVYISDEDDRGRELIVPDLRIVPRDRPGLAPAAGVALDVDEPIVEITMLDDEVHEARLEVIDRSDRSVITVIEVLSPTNKLAGSRGRDSFMQKRREVMGSPTHWAEIDLLRAGQSLPIRQRIRPHEYLVHVSKAHQRPRGLLWPIRLDQRLPVVSIPLSGDDPDARLDLQAVLTTVYDRAGYDAQLNYRAEPVPPLEPDWAEWVDRLLRDRGLR